MGVVDVHSGNSETLEAQMTQEAKYKKALEEAREHIEDDDTMNESEQLPILCHWRREEVLKIISKALSPDPVEELRELLKEMCDSGDRGANHNRSVKALAILSSGKIRSADGY